MDRQYIFGLNTSLTKAIENVLEIPLYRLSLCFVLELSLHPAISFSLLLLQSSLSMTMTSEFLSFLSTKTKMSLTKTKMSLLYLTEGETNYILVISISLKSKISANALKL